MESKELIRFYNKEIAKFMGYIYYHPGVDVEDDGLSCIKEIFSKVPIEVVKFEDEEYPFYYFNQVSNPDFGKENPKHWNSDIETLPWCTINYQEFITDLDYNNNWNSLMEVVEKIEELGCLVTIKSNKCNIVNLKKEDVDVFVEQENKILATFFAVGKYCEKINQSCE